MFIYWEKVPLLLILLVVLSFHPFPTHNHGTHATLFLFSPGTYFFFFFWILLDIYMPLYMHSTHRHTHNHTLHTHTQTHTFHIQPKKNPHGKRKIYCEMCGAAMAHTNAVVVGGWAGVGWVGLMLDLSVSWLFYSRLYVCTYVHWQTHIYVHRKPHQKWLRLT